MFHEWGPLLHKKVDCQASEILFSMYSYSEKQIIEFGVCFSHETITWLICTSYLLIFCVLCSLQLLEKVANNTLNKIYICCVYRRENIEEWVWGNYIFQWSFALSNFAFMVPWFQNERNESFDRFSGLTHCPSLKIEIPHRFASQML